MKMKKLLTILVVVNAYSCILGRYIELKQELCPVVNPSDHDVLLPSKDCTKFYKCDHGVPVVQDCPEGLQWSQSLQRCDYPEVAKCSGHDVDPEPPVEPENPTTPQDNTPLPTKCPEVNPDGHDVLLPSKDCSKFYKCDHGVPIVQDCPEGLQWSQSLQRCDYPEVAKCSGHDVDPETPVDPEPPVEPEHPTTPKDNTPLPTKCPEVNPDGHDVLLPSKDCSKFYKCDHGVPVVQDCPEGLQWSQSLQRCDYPEVAKCSGHDVDPEQPVEPENPTTPQDNTPLPTKCPEVNPDGHDVLLPSKDCSKFYKCDHGVPVVQDCPEGLQWSQSLQRCDYPEVAKCSGHDVDPETPVDPEPPVEPEHPTTPKDNTPLPTKCPEVNPDGHDVLLPSKDCSKFYKCDHGVPVVQDCPEGLQWSQSLQRCDYPEVAKCSGHDVDPEPPVEPENPTTPQDNTPLPTKCPEVNPDGHDVLLPSKDCSKFYKCDHGVPVVQDCPAGLQWSQSLQRCDYPEVAKCSGHDVDPETPVDPEPPVEPEHPTTPKDNTPLPTKCPEVNPDGHDVLLPSKDCSKFYKCDHGVPVVQDCPEGLQWSQSLQRCDYPEVAKCSGHDVDPEPPVEPENPTTPQHNTPLPTKCPEVNPDGHDVLLPSKDCSKFYKCDHGVPVVQDCPEGLQWSQILQRCDYPEVAKCSGHDVDPETPVDPEPPVEPEHPTTPKDNTPLPTKCPEVNPDGHDVLLPSKDCSKFYKCDHGVPVVQDCPEGLQWSQSLQRCDYPEVAKCSGHDVDPEPPVEPENPTTPQDNTPLPTKCPEVNPDGHDVLLPSKDCSKFYKCDHGVPVVQDCPEGLQWSQSLQRCDYPEVAKCSGHDVDPETPVDPEPPVEPENPTTPQDNTPLPTKCPEVNPDGHDVLLPSKDCSKFYKCDHGVPVVQDCPEGLQWSQSLQRCDYPEVAKCSGHDVDPEPPVEPENPTTPQDNTPLPTKCPEVNPDGHDVLLPSKDCSKFYKCDHGVPVVQDCPEGLQWSQSLQRCDYPEVAKCSGHDVDPETPVDPEPPVEPEHPTTPKDNTPLPTKCPEVNPDGHDVLLPSKDCSKFYKCDHGVPVVQDCPEGLQWSQSLQRCDYPEVAKCSGHDVDPEQPVEPENPTTPQDNTPLPTKCPEVNPDGHDVLLPSKDCSKFYKCDHGVPVVQDCPEGLQWSQSLQRCDYPEVAKCSGHDVDPETPVDPEPPVEPEHPTTPKDNTPLPTKCPEVNPDGHDVLLPSKDCSKFYKCDHGVPVVQDCPEGLQWSQSLQRCDYPEVAKCSGHDVDPEPPVEPENPTTPQDNTPLPTKCPEVNPDGHDVLLPSKDCSKFYKCDHGVPVVQDCPAGLQWSQSLQRCDYPEVAKCSGHDVDPETPVDPEPPVEPEHPTTPKDNTPLPTKCPEVNPDGHDVLLPSKDCSKFYKCDHGVPVVQDCPEGLQWSQSLQRCDYPEVAKCSGHDVDPEPPVEPENPTTPQHNTPLPTKCPEVNPDGHDVLLPSKDCSKFYKCDHGVPVVQDCPEGLQWSQILQRCDYPEVAKCSGHDVDPETPVDPEPPVEPEHPTTPKDNTPLPTKCPEVNPDRHDVLLPSKDCSKFYKCDHGVPVVQDCPEGLQWSQSLQRCDYPEVAKCSGHDVDPEPPVEPENPTTPQDNTPLPTKCPEVNPDGHDVLLPSKDCSKFYKCDHGVPVVQDCPEGLQWSQSLQRCDYPEVAKCSGHDVDPETPVDPEPPVEPENPTTPQDNTPLPTKCPEVNPDGHDVLLPSKDCSKFYKCDHGVPVVQDCPEGLQWSQSLQRCDYPEVAKCSGHDVDPEPPVEPENPTTPQDNTPLPTKCPEVNPDGHDVLLPSKDCSKFYKCDHGVPVVQDCPEGLQWSQSLQRCDYPEVAKCSGHDVDPETPVDPEPPLEPEHPTTPKDNTPLPTKCPAVNPEDHDVLLPAKDCSHFYKCDHGLPVLQECPEGLQWRQNLQRCDYPELAKCVA